MQDIFLYHIKDGYINYLRNFDDKVLFNKNETRPYVGIVLEVKKDDGLNHKYFVPLSSPKAKHETVKNTEVYYVSKLDFYEKWVRIYQEWRKLYMKLERQIFNTFQEMTRKSMGGVVIFLCWSRWLHNIRMRKLYARK